MFNKKLIFVSTILTAALMTGCAENGAPYGAGYGNTDSRRPQVESGSDIGDTGGCDSSYGGTGAVSSKPTEDIEPDDEGLFADTKTVSYPELEQIPANMTYGEILKTLGKTAAFGRSNYRQYLTFDNRLIQLHFDSKDDICPYSGVELFNNALPLKKESSFGHAIVINDNSGHVTYFSQNYSTKELSLTSMVLLVNDNTKFKFENGLKATEDDFKKAGTAVRFETDGVEMYSNPPQTICTKITIVDLEPTPVAAPYDETLDDGSVKTYYPDGVTVTKFPGGGVETYLPYPDGGVVEYKPPQPDHDYTVDTEDLFHELTTVNREQMSSIPANTSYGDILEKLGSTQAYGQSNYRQYVTDDDRIIQLCFDSTDDLCPYSGEELYDRALPLRYDGETPDGMIYGILGRDGGFFTHYDTYYTDSITGDYIMTSDAEIIFEDGTPATKDDLKPEARVFVQGDYVLESYPGRRHCTKIVILK